MRGLFLVKIIRELFYIEILNIFDVISGCFVVVFKSLVLNNFSCVSLGMYWVIFEWMFSCD